MKIRNFGIGVGCLGACLVLAGCASRPATLEESTADVSSELRPSEAGCDAKPTGIATSDYFLDFIVPAGLMPDSKFDGRAAHIEVHRVQPVYAHGKCPSVRTSAAVLIHGRAVPGPSAFDHRHDGGGELSVQENLARAGIDTFAPSLLGYGRSSTFEDGLDDPCNASLRPYPSPLSNSCPYPEGCDLAVPVPPYAYDQQNSQLGTNPLSSGRCAHSTSTRFARMDVWVRDVRQVVDDAILRAQPASGKVTLIGYSAGAPRVGRALYQSAADYNRPWLRRDDIDHVRDSTDRVVFIAPLLIGPNEEPEETDMNPANGPFITFPLAISGRVTTGRWDMSAARHLVCTGHYVSGSAEEQFEQTLARDALGSQWGGTNPADPTGVSRVPTFSTYGLNANVAPKIDKPTLVLQGLDDSQARPELTCPFYNALPAENKVLVELDCASHTMLVEGCSGTRCEHEDDDIPPAYGTRGDDTWAGPSRTIQAALVEWINDGKFHHERSGRFLVDTSGVVSASAGVCALRQ